MPGSRPFIGVVLVTGERLLSHTELGILVAGRLTDDLSGFDDSIDTDSNALDVSERPWSLEWAIFSAASFVSMFLVEAMASPDLAAMARPVRASITETDSAFSPAIEPATILAIASTPRNSMVPIP